MLDSAGRHARPRRGPAAADGCLLPCAVLGEAHRYMTLVAEAQCVLFLVLRAAFVFAACNKMEQLDDRLILSSTSTSIRFNYDMSARTSKPRARKSRGS